MQSILRGIVGILGFGVDGRHVAEFLGKQDTVEGIVVFDDSTKCEMRNEKCEYGENLKEVDLLFRSPGFPVTHPLVQEAKEKNIPITSSTAQVLENLSQKVIGVTGSNGKTTCVELITAMLKEEFGEDRVERGGNDGVPRLDLLCHAERSRSKTQSSSLDYARDDTFVVLELSSFQLIDCPVSPDVAVVLNISPNHLDWHADMEEYTEAKRQIVAHQKEGDLAVLNPDDAAVKKFSENIQSDVLWFKDMPESTIRCKTHPDTIRAAVTTAQALGVAEKHIDQVLAEFPGVPHRLEFVREVDEVSYYNDSSCTTPESAITACNAFPEGSMVLLLGGRDKGMDFTELYKVIKERDARVVPYGEMAETFIQILDTKYLIPNTKYQSFESAIAAARTAGRTNVVLSPACASFDMFANAKDRGESFSEIVRGL